MFAHSYGKSYHKRAMVENDIRPAKQFSFQMAAERC